MKKTVVANEENNLMFLFSSFMQGKKYDGNKLVYNGHIASIKRALATVDELERDYYTTETFS